MDNNKVSTVASRANYLYYYVIYSVISSLISIFFSYPQLKDTIKMQQLTAAKQLSASEVHTVAVLGVGFGILLSFSFYVYLLRSKRVKLVRALLTILLVFGVFGILIQFSKVNIASIVLEIIGVVFLGVTLRQVVGIAGNQSDI